jgi:AbiV family abortive infection protein
LGAGSWEDGKRLNLDGSQVSIMARGRCRVFRQPRGKNMVTEQFFLEGAAYALEHCGCLLRDAVALYERGSYASAVVLTMFGREELGKYRMLREAFETVAGGGTVELKDLTKKGEGIYDHMPKQEHAVLSVVYRSEPGTQLDELLRARIKLEAGSPEWRKVDKELQELTEATAKDLPINVQSRVWQELSPEPELPMAEAVCCNPHLSITIGVVPCKKGFVRQVPVKVDEWNAMDRKVPTHTSRLLLQRGCHRNERAMRNSMVRSGQGGEHLGSGLRAPPLQDVACNQDCRRWSRQPRTGLNGTASPLARLSAFDPCAHRPG